MMFPTKCLSSTYIFAIWGTSAGNFLTHAGNILPSNMQEHLSQLYIIDHIFCFLGDLNFPTHAGNYNTPKYKDLLGIM